MHLLHLVVAFVVALAVVGDVVPASANEITTANTGKSNLAQDAAFGGNEATRELTGPEEDEERRGGRGGGGGGRGGGRGTSRGTGGGGGGYVYHGGYYGTNTHLGFWNTNSVSDRHKKCNRFVNWIKRLFNPNIKKCPKKKKDEDEYTRHLRI